MFRKTCFICRGKGRLEILEKDCDVCHGKGYLEYPMPGDKTEEKK